LDTVRFTKENLIIKVGNLKVLYLQNNEKVTVKPLRFKESKGLLQGLLQAKEFNKGSRGSLRVCLNLQGLRVSCLAAPFKVLNSGDLFIDTWVNCKGKGSGCSESGGSRGLRVIDGELVTGLTRRRHVSTGFQGSAPRARGWHTKAQV
jgi:hypothetical protein